MEGRTPTARRDRNRSGDLVQQSEILPGNVKRAGERDPQSPMVPLLLPVAVPTRV